MKIGMLTTYNTRCGIAEYSRNIAKAMLKRDDIEFEILGSVNHAEYDIADHEEYVHPVFEVKHWTGYDGFATDYILNQNYDLIHVQYQSMLYNYGEFLKFLNLYKGKLVITFHDNCQPQGFPYASFDKSYTHREGVGRGELIPFGVENRKPIIKTFGLGRSRWDIIEDVCKELGFQFEHSFGDKRWLPTEDLYQWLRAADVIVLWYDDVSMAGSSQAARQAISTRRPVIVNNVTWFKDLPSRGRDFVKVDTIEELKGWLKEFTDNGYIDGNDWSFVADKLVQDYNELLNG